MTSSTSSSDAPGYSWKRFFRQFVGVLVAFALANVVIYNASQYFQKEQHYHDIVDGARARAAVRVLFAGDSHFAQPLNGYLNDNPQSTGYSVAYGGDSAREMFAKVRRVLETNPSIDTLVLSADAHMFGAGRVSSSNRSFADRYFLAERDPSGLPNGWISTVLDFVPLFNDDFVQYLRKTVSTAFSTHKGPRGTTGGDSGAGFGGAINTAAAAGAGEGRVAGASAAPGTAAPKNRWASLSEEDRVEQARQVGEMDHQGVGDHKEPFFWYSRILQLARERNVRAIGARFPVHPAYSAQIDPARQARIDEFLRSEGVADIVDLSNGLTDPHDFDDPDHVNQSGAEKVLHLLAARLPHPLFANAPSAP